MLAEPKQRISLYALPGLQRQQEDFVRNNPEIMCERIIAGVCAYYDLPTNALFMRTREHQICFARMVAISTIRKIVKKKMNDILVPISIEDIGKVFGLHHTTIINALKVISNHLDTGYREKEIQYLQNHFY